MCAVKDVEVVARYPLAQFEPFRVGDVVRVDMPVKGGLKAAFIMYVVPLLGLALGMTGGYFAGFPEWGSLLLGLAVMAAVYAVVALNNRRFEANPDYMGEVVALLEHAGDGEECGIAMESVASARVQIDPHYESQNAKR